MSNIMNEYTTFHKVLDYLQYFQEQSPMLNTFGYGNLVDFGKNVSGSSVNYPFLFVVPQAIEYQENMTVYSLTMIFADILNWDLSNEKDCVSDMSWEAKRFLAYLKNGQNTLPILYNNIDINLPVTALPFFERFGDHVAGVAMEVPLIVYDTLDACDYYPEQSTNYYVAGCERMEYHVISYTGTGVLTGGTIVNNYTPECWTIISATTQSADVGVINQVFSGGSICDDCIVPTTSVYSQVLSFTGTPNYNSIQYRCDGTQVAACYSIENQNNMTDLVDLFNTQEPDPLPPSCDNPTFCYCWTDYGTYYDNGDDRVRCEMPTSLYNTLCSGGTLTLNVIND